MKTKYSRLGNSAVSIILAVLMVISSTIVGSSSSIDSIAADTPDTVSQTVAEPETNVSEANKVVADSAIETSNIESASENEEQVSKNESEVSTPKIANRDKMLPEKSGDRQKIYLLGSNFSTESVSTMTSHWEASGRVEMDYDDSCSCYYKDVYLGYQSLFRFSSTDNTWTANIGPSANKEQIRLKDRNNKATTNNGSTDYNWYFLSDGSATGRDTKYRIVYDMTNSKVWVTNIATRIIGGEISSSSDSALISWNTSNTIGFAESTYNDYQASIYINRESSLSSSDLGFQLFNQYESTGSDYDRRYYGPGGTMNVWSSSSDELNFLVNNTSSNTTFGSGVTTGSYVMHYNPTNAHVWLTRAAATYNINANTPEHGTVSVASSATSGSSVSVTLTPESGYTSVLLVKNHSDSSVYASFVGNNSPSFTMPAYEVDVEAVFVQTTNYTVTPAAGTGGSVSPSTAQTVQTGNSTQITATPTSDDYLFSSWTISGTENEDYVIASGSSLTASPITVYPLNDITVTASFTENRGSAYTNTQFIYGTNDDVASFTNHGITIYKRVATASDITNIGESNYYKIKGSDSTTRYSYYVDIDTSSTKQIYFQTGENGDYKNIATKTGWNDGIAAFSVTTSDSNLVTVEQKNRGRNDDGTYTEYYFGRLSVGSSVTKVRIYLGRRDDGNNKGPDGTHFHVVPLTTASATEANTVTVYAKSGTIRNKSEGGNQTTDKYSRLATTEVAYTDGTTFTENTDIWHSRYNASDDGETAWQRLTVASVTRNKEIRITVTLKSELKDTYYVKAFSINGETDPEFVLKSQNDAPVDSNGAHTGVYTCTYTPGDDAPNRIEITPIYYYFVSDDSTAYNYKENFINFTAENFTDDVKDLWGDQIACYAFYSGVNSEGNAVTTPSDTVSATATNKSALGGYPGQPMVKIGNSYYMQIPKTLENGAVIEGITMNNYVWDTIHAKYILNLDMSTTTSRENANCQTYDYDDMVAIDKLKSTDKIVFNFKYGTYNGSSDTTEIKTELGNVPPTDASNNDLSFVSGGNGWKVLTDYYDHPVDLFARRLVDPNADEPAADEEPTYITESTVKSTAANEKIFVVSNGYEAYYYQKNADNADKSDERAKYVGQYGTRWYVYKTTDGTNYSYIGALPPSAFLTGLASGKDVPVKVGYANSKTTQEKDAEISKTNFLNYSAAATQYKAGNSGETTYNDLDLSTWTDYKAIYEECAGLPVQITYESNLYSGGKDGTTQNKGFRSDGRWYYSVPNSKIEANIVVQVIDANGDIVAINNNASDTYQYDTWTETDGVYVSDVVGAKAYFTNEDAVLNGKVDANVYQSDNFFTFIADHTSVGSNGKHYIFRGWYSNTGDNYYTQINPDNKRYALTGEQPMDGNVTLIARYQEYDPTKTLKITHDMLSTESSEGNVPTIHNGKGTASLTVEILDDNGDRVKFINNTTPGSATIDAVTLSEIKALTNGSNYKVKVTLNTVTDSGTIVVGTYRKETDNGTNTYYKSGTTGFSEPASGNGSTQDSFGDANDGTPAKTLTTSTSGSTTTSQLVYEYTFAELYSGENLAKPELKFFSDALTNTISVEFCYYDRKIVSGQPTTMNDEPETFTTNVSIDNKTITGAITDAFVQFNDIQKGNVIDSYKCWMTQATATTEIQNLDNYRSPNAEKTSGYNSYADSLVSGNFKYQSGFDAENDNAPVYTEYTPDFSRHTNLYGMPEVSGSTTADKWVTYYDAEGKEINTAEATLVDSQKTSVSSVKVWLYNTPKLYTVNVWAPTGVDDTTVTQSLGGKYYTNNNPVPQKGFYNQRIGVEDTNEGGIAAGSNSQSDYLTGYGIHTVYTGDKIAAPTRIHRNNEQADLLFDGWYSATIVEVDDGEGNKTQNVTDLTKVSSDVVYGNRITTDLTLVAVYKESVSNTVGVSVVDNGIDYYVENNTRMVRFNTELNVYNAIDSDPNIKQVSAIYVRLPAQVTVSGATRAFTAADLTSEIVNSIRIELNTQIYTNEMLNRDFSNDTVMKIVDVTKLALDKDGKIISYSLTVNDDTDHSAKLTNKNRTQFVMPMAAVYYEGGANCAILAYAAINYDQDGDYDTAGAETDEWILSDNYVPYIYYEKPSDIPG